MVGGRIGGDLVDAAVHTPESKSCSEARQGGTARAQRRPLPIPGRAQAEEHFSPLWAAEAPTPQGRLRPRPRSRRFSRTGRGMSGSSTDPPRGRYAKMKIVRRPITIDWAHKRATTTGRPRLLIFSQGGSRGESPVLTARGPRQRTPAERTSSRAPRGRKARSRIDASALMPAGSQKVPVVAQRFVSRSSSPGWHGVCPAGDPVRPGPVSPGARRPRG